MSLLSLIEDAADIIGVDKPSSVIDSADATAVQMLALAKLGGKQLAKRGKGIGGWAVLQTEHTFDTVADQAEYALPSDFDFFVQDTLWDRNNFWKLRGPLDAGRWQIYKSGIISSGPRRRVRIKPSASSNVKAFFVDPTPGDSGETLVYEYVSTFWCQSAGGTGKAAWTADTDTGILDEYLMLLDLIWRFKAAKGLEYGEDFRQFELELQQALGRDGGRPTLNLRGSESYRFIEHANLPDSGFGV